MSSHHSYETLYGVGLLDDLHNYFPAILYEPDSFHSVPGLLRYVQQQTRNRFDLFSLGQREYQGSPVPVSVPVPVAGNTSAFDVSANPPPAHSILTPPRTQQQQQQQQPPAAPARQSIRNTLSRFPNMDTPMIQYMFELPEQDEETHFTSRLLLSLLAAPLARRTGGLDAFLQPIEVRPTAEQIATNTTVGNLVSSDEEHPCAICQDTLAPDQEGRKLNTCGHWFHKTCIDIWFERNVHCPVCRHDIRESTTAPTTTPTE